MDNKELKKKIVDMVISKVWVDSFEDEIVIDRKVAEAFADALIATGLGDVKEAKFEADHYWNMWQGALVELERAEHRAEVAERALQKFAEYITCEDCPFFSDCASSEKMGYPIHSYHCFSEYLKQAEKELEGKE